MDNGAAEVRLRQHTHPLRLPYSHLNLRCNPFGPLTRPEKDAISVRRLDLKPYIDRLRAPGFALQFLKEGARNKTTHLLAIQRAFPQAPFIKLPQGQPLPAIPDAPLLFLDWLHLMPRRHRRRLFRRRWQGRRVSFGIVSHANHGRELRAAGLRTELVKLPAYTPAQLKEQIDRCIAWAQRDPDRPVPAVSLDRVTQLLDQLGNETVVFDYLYRRVQALAEVGEV